ncbi:hypothetical protein LX77_02452 [Gelidibacter algens]|uniref:Uncharacterized protein n=1 Tax=Gelidibacter algens TaxID=49280 RepID=A0A1A7R344_9FLAO|nr:hypothetical protein [Gelidibacter algens]OBX25187.1 hypothetical protein A9996_11255 [Gelidibacter algens]RAJ22506.1 hypothetical protein LX77_02452 [Gelidibacter algens]
MGQQKWEDSLKEKLEKRAITPSEASWNTLAERLESAENRKSKTLFWRLGIAASMIGVLFTTALVFKDAGSEIRQPVVVETQKQVEDQLIPMDKLPQQKQLAETEERVESLESLEKNTSKTELLKTQKSLTSPIKENLSVAKNERNKSLEPLKISPQKETLEDQKVSEIVAQIKDLEKKGEAVTDADIDALLRKAQRELTHQAILKESIRTVDASALLQDVETDLQHSFRNKIFEALKTSYETVITAVADRNN